MLSLDFLFSGNFKTSMLNPEPPETFTNILLCPVITDPGLLSFKVSWLATGVRETGSDLSKFCPQVWQISAPWTPWGGSRTWAWSTPSWPSTSGSQSRYGRIHNQELRQRLLLVFKILKSEKCMIVPFFRKRRHLLHLSWLTTRLILTQGDNITWLNSCFGFLQYKENPENIRLIF